MDRKDLDRQTREEFNRFQEGCVEENTNTATLVRRMLSDDMADKVIVTTIQKLGLALDENSKRNQQRAAQGRQTFTQRLEPLRDRRFVFIFDECHRSQFGDNHQAIKEFFPRAQLFGFTGTPIFEDNAARVKIADNQASFRTTLDTFQRELHKYTITHAIEDKNVLRFHVDYFRPEGEETLQTGEALKKEKIVEAILDKHAAATHARRFNALLATASIDDAIEYHGLFQTVQTARQAADPDFVPLKVACVFSPPVPPADKDKNAKDIEQLQEDLPQEQKDNKKDPAKKKAALTDILAAYNTRYGTNHSVAEFDLYYQDIQKRIKDQKFPNADLPRKGAEKIDVTIVVDMLLTGFDSQYLNTLYVDKNLKHHGLIQAFSRTNRVLNATKPHGHILDFRQQQAAVDAAVILFSGVDNGMQAREIWLVESAPKIVEKLKDALDKLDDFMKSQGLEAKPENVPALRGDEARAAFIERFREVQRLKTQLDQYTDISLETETAIEKLLPTDQLNAYRGVYLDIAQGLRAEQDKAGATPIAAVDQLDFEFVLFASADIDYDYIMALLARFSQQTPSKQAMSREQLIGLIQADAKFMDERDTIADYVRTLKAGQGLDEKEIEAGYRRFRDQRHAAELTGIAQRHGLAPARLQTFVDAILQRMVFDGEQLTELLEPLGLAWKARRVAELALMEALVPLLKKRAAGRNISGLNAYET